MGDRETELLANPRWDSQHGFDLRFDWGQAGVHRLAPYVGTIVVVDVLRFTTAVETAVASGVSVYPYRWRDQSAKDFAASVGAQLALKREDNGPSLSPQSLMRLEPGSRIVLPSPNGAACTLKAAELGANTIAGCLRNASSAARWAASARYPVGVIACGELDADGLLRPAIEDMVGAGAIMASLSGSPSPEAEAAVAAYADIAGRLTEVLRNSTSARELLSHGWDDDVEWSLEVDVSDVVPVLKDGRFEPAPVVHAR